ncbi:unnamed protein product [Mytilus edulis]|uniref:B box-type domain-containing protein n=1 Tax=Mytilus edulis TaxID=6550 RepID=A0A8S3QPV1_MYTED|nr:unnamed protein product [Mytilus edulis]
MSEEKYLQSIINDSNSFKCLKLKCSISDNIMHFSDIKSFGSISTDVSASSAELITEKEKQAQILFPTSMANKSIEDLQLTEIRQFKVPCNDGITGHTLCPNGDMVFVDFRDGKRLLIVDSTGSLKREISFPNTMPYDVTSIDNGTLAVTTWADTDIHVVDINSGTITAHISGGFCGGITRRGNTLICCVLSNEIKTVDLRDNAVSAFIPMVPINRQTYVTASSDKIYVTHPNNNTVTCYKMNGDQEWQYLDSSMVKLPLGITVDKHNNVMATSTNIVCGICEAQHITKCADHWCPECDEGLCNHCEKHHSISKGTQKHGVIPTEDYKKLPPDILSIGHHCQEHEKKFQNYCPHHEKLCCPSCISTEHRKCVGFLDLDEIIKTSKTSVLIQYLEKSYKDIATNINNIIIDRKGNLAKIREQRHGFHTEIKQVRVKINTHLDKLEQQIISDLLSEERKIETQIETLLNQLSEKIATVHDLQNNIVAIKNHASDLQTFLARKRLEECAMSEEKYLQSIMNDSNSLKCVKLKCSISDNIMNILDIKSFGSISTDVNPSTVVLTLRKEKQAQILHQTIIANKSIENLQVTKIRQFKVPCKSGITGFTFCPNGDMVFVDYNDGRRLLIMDSMGNFRREISLPSIQPYDVTSIDENTVAVTTWLKNGIHVVDINSGTIKACISGNFCGGITRRGNTLICCVLSNEITTVDLRDNAVSALIPEVPIYRETYVTTSSDKIFVTHYTNNTVTCYKMNGDKEWLYHNQSMVNKPLGIYVDKYNNVYVSSFGNHSVVLISPDGKKVRKILGKEDGIVSPYCVHYNQNQNNLLVTCFHGNAFLIQHFIDS